MTTVLVTGANRGIGLEFVRQYAADGADVIAACRAPDGAHDLAALAREHQGRIKVVPLDVTDAASVALLARRLKGRPIDILISNAGVKGGNRQQFGSLDYYEWAHCLTVNLMGPVRICEALADNVAAGKEKKIVNVSSRMGSIAQAGTGGYIYRTSKTALNMATRLLALDLQDRGISVITVHPGWVQTDMGGPNATLPPEESVSGLRALIERAASAMSGRFWNYDGEEISW
jgi:NAD(P)-dependent dehydrogenase (short-subunit alcohol dehydrogenase family)